LQQGWYSFGIFVKRMKWTSWLKRKPKRALPRFIVNHEQKVSFKKRPGCALLLLSVLSLSPPHQNAAPPIRCGISYRTKEGFPALGMMRAFPERQRWFQ